MDVTNPLTAFEPLEDVRVIGRCDHKLIDIIVLSVCAVICGADTWVDIHEFGKCKEQWLRKFLKLPNGIPSHDTLGRVFSLISPVKFEQCFSDWVKRACEKTNGQIIPIDGKTLRRSYDKGSSKAALHMVSAWGAENGIVLGQVNTEEKSNEITAIPELLSCLDINGCVITIDAMGCQKAITQKIIDGGGDYVIAVKENQPTLYKEVVDCMDDALERGQCDKKSVDFYETTESGHGRKEIRRYYIVDNIDDVESSVEWPGLNTIGMVESIRTVNGESTRHCRYYIASIEKEASYFGLAVRKHWGIENSLHWVLDVAFKEDDSRIRIGNAAGNFSLLRRIALNYLKSEKTSKRGIQGKRNAASWDTNYLEKVLGIQ